jgi:hypothetical protein
MTERRFYAFAAALPLVAPLAGAAVGGLGMHNERQAPGMATKVGVLLAFIGFYSTVPYLLFLLLSWRRLRRADAAGLRRIAWLTPLLIAIPFAPVFALTSGSGGGVSAFAMAAGIGAAWALVTGYFYVAVIEAARMLGMWSGLLKHGGKPG